MTISLNRRAALVGALAGSAVAIATAASAVGAAAPSSITELFAQWQAAGAACDAAASEEGHRHFYEVYAELQSRIVEMTPATAREAAMQFVVETDYGDSDFHDAYYHRVHKLAMEG